MNGASRGPLPLGPGSTLDRAGLGISSTSPPCCAGRTPPELGEPVNPVSRIVRRGEVDIALTPKEFALLQELMRRAGEVLSRNLLDQPCVWDFAYDGISMVDVYMRYLRDKVDRPFERDTIRTVRGAGYRLDADG